MPTIGFAELDVVPVLKGGAAGVQKQLAPNLTAAASSAGLKAGQAAGSGIAKGATAASHKGTSGIFTNLEKGAVASGTKTGRYFGTALHETVGEYTKSIGTLAAGFLAFEKVKDVVKDLFSEGEQAQKTQALLEAHIESTGGAAGVTASHIEELAKKQSALIGVDRDTIEAGAGLVLTFANIRNEAGKGNDVFDRTLSIGEDMAAAYGMSLTQALRLVGRAVNDPVHGLTSLTKVGVQFTTQQQTQIKTLVASGHALEAQKLVLDQLGVKFAGSAKAADTPLKQLHTDVTNLSQAAGKDLVPAINSSATGLVHLGSAVAAIPGPVKLAAVAWLAYQAAQKLGVGTAVAAAETRVASAVDSTRLRVMLAADAYRAATVAEDGFTAGSGRATAAMAGMRAGAAGLGVSVGGGLTRGLRGALSLVGGPWGAAFIAGTVLVTHFWEQHKEAVQYVDDLTQSLDQQSGSLSENSRNLIYNNLLKSGAVDAAKRLGINLADLQAAAEGSETAIAGVNDVVNTFMAGAATGDDGGLGVGPSDKDTEDKIKAAYKLRDALGDSNNAIAKARRGWQDQSQALHGSTTATEESTSATEKGTGATQKSTTALLKHITALNKDADAALKGRQDRLALVEQMQATSHEAVTGKKAFDLNTKAGQANRSALYDLAQQWNGSAARVQNATGLYAKVRREFIADAIQMGATGAQARNLARDILHVPHRLPLDVSQALTGLQRVQHQLDGLHNKKLYVTVALSGASHALSVEQQLADIADGKRAGGGSVSRRRPYFVGEKGPELFVPRVSGRIMSNSEAMAAASAPAAAAPRAATFIFNGNIVAQDYRDLMQQVQRRARRSASDGVRRPS